MGKALVLGNGESRSGVSLDSFSFDTLIGCNAVYRDIAVDHLVCVDSRMVDEATGNTTAKIHTRGTLPSLPYTGSDRADMPIHWGSGPYAVLLATTLADDITLLGFDLYGQAGKVNNMYKGTRNYSAPTSHAIDYSYWVYQIGKVFEHYPLIRFTVINHAGWQLPDDWILPNVKFLPLNH